MLLVEREEQLAELRTVLAHAAHGRGSVAVVSGPVACGKTELLHAFAEQAADSGALLATASASAAEQALPLGVLTQLLRSVGLAEDRVARLTRSAGRRAEPAGPFADGPGPAGDNDVEQAPPGVPEAVCAALFELAARAPLLIAVDDVHHTDPPSWQCLSYLIRRLRRVRIAMVLTECVTPLPTRRPWFLGEALREAHSRTIRVAPLTPLGVERVVAEQHGPLVARRLAPDYHALSQGSPLLLRALLHDHAAAPEPAFAPSAGEAYGRAVLSYLYRCGPTTVRMARGIAVLDAAGTPELLDQLVDPRARSAEPVIEGLTEAGLLEDGRFRHATARAAVLDSLAPDERTELYLRAARTVHRAGEPPERVAELLAAAGHCDDQWAATVLHDAAEQLLVADRVAEAVELLELALRCTDDERQQAAVTAALARAGIRVNPAKALSHLPALLAAFRRGVLGEGDALVLARLLLWQGRSGEAVEVLGALARAAGAETSGALRAIRLWLSYSHPAVAAEIAAAAGPLDEGPSRALVAAIDPRLTAATALSGLLTAGPREQQVADAVRVLQTVRLGRHSAEAVEDALLVLVYADRLAEAADWCERFRLEAVSRQAPAWQSLFSVVDSIIAMRRGDLPTAFARAEESFAANAPSAWGVMIGMPLGSLILAATAMGDHATAARYVDQPVHEGVFGTRFGLHYLEARGAYHLATGQHHAALAGFEACGERLREWHLDASAFLLWRAGASVALLGLGQREQARRLAEEQLGLCADRRSRAYGVSLRVLAGTLKPAERRKPLIEAVRVLQGSGDRYQLAVALADLSQAHKAAGMAGVARVTRHRAWFVAKACRAEALCQALLPARAVPTDRAVPQARAVESLTGAEQRVAALAAEGHSNREIASTLCITISTVEQHLTQVYRKLRIKQRADLPDSLHLDGLLKAA